MCWGCVPGERGFCTHGWLAVLLWPLAETHSLSSHVGVWTPYAHPSRGIRLESVDGSVTQAWRYPAREWDRVRAVGSLGEHLHHHHATLWLWWALPPPLCGHRGFIRWFFPFWWVNLIILKLAYVNQFVQYGDGKVGASPYFIYIDVAFCGKIVVYRF